MDNTTPRQRRRNTTITTSRVHGAHHKMLDALDHAEWSRTDRELKARNAKALEAARKLEGLANIRIHNIANEIALLQDQLKVVSGLRDSAEMAILRLR